MSQAEDPSDMKRRIVVDYTINHELPEELKKLVYIDGNKLYEDEIASLVSRRVKDLKNEDEVQRGPEKEIPLQNKIIENNYGTINNKTVNLGDNVHLRDINF